MSTYTFVFTTPKALNQELLDFDLAALLGSGRLVGTSVEWNTDMPPLATTVHVHTTDELTVAEIAAIGGA